MKMKKSFLTLVLIIMLLFAVLSGCSSNEWSNDTTTITRTTTTVPTTLSEEEILKNYIKVINEDVSKGLKEKYEYLSVEFACYVNFQDFIYGLESEPSDFFFLGTEEDELAQLYDDTKFYKNEDALDFLKEKEYGDADYILYYTGTKKDAYGKEQNTILVVPVKDKSDGGCTWWYFDGFDGVNLPLMILNVARERCTNYFV